MSNVLAFRRPESREDGTQPPHDQHAEAALLTTCILKPETIPEVLSIALPEDFYSRAHQEIATALRDMHAAGTPVDLVSVGTRLNDTGKLETVGGVAELIRMANEVASLVDPKRAACTVRDKAILRRLATEARRLCAECYEPQESPRPLLERVELLARELTATLGRGTSESLLDVAKGMARDMANPMPPVATTGFRWLDERTAGGFRPGQLWYVGARPGTGKSVLAGQLALAAESGSRRVVYASLEMGAGELLERLACTRAGIPYERWVNGEVMHMAGAFNLAVSDLVSNKRMEIVDTPAVTVLDLEAIAREKKAQMLVVDYLQLVSSPKAGRGSSRSREQEVSEMSRGLKLLARKLEIPVVALCQLSRASAKDNRRPRMEDLRESGSLEQDADGVLFLWRPKYNDPDATPEEKAGGELILGKLRKGTFGVSCPIRLAGSGFVEDHRDV